MIAKVKMRLDSRGRLVNPLICSSSELAEKLCQTCDWFTGVPDNMYRNILPKLKPYVAAPRENHALAMAFGVRLGDKRPCALIQNSGLGLCGDVLYGLFHLYQVGVLLVVTWRGELAWEEVQHHLWGRKTIDYLCTLDANVFDLQNLGLAAVTKAAECAFALNKPSVLLVHRGNIDE